MRPLTGVALGLLALVASGCTAAEPVAEPVPETSQTSAPATSADPRRAEVQEALDARADAILAGDRARFLAGTTRTHRAERGRWFDRLTALPLAEVSFALGTHDADVDGPDSYAAEVTVLVQIDEFDDAPVPTEQQLAFRRVGGAWRVAEVTADDSVRSFAPWQFDDARIAVGDRVIVVADAGSPGGYAAHLLRLAETATADVAAIVPDDVGDWNGHVVLLAPSRMREFEYEGLDPRELARSAAWPIGCPALTTRPWATGSSWRPDSSGTATSR